MRRHWPVFVPVVCAVLAAQATILRPVLAQQENGVRWQLDLEAAKTLARQTNRLVLVHFWTPSCAPCLALDHNVFNQPGVGGALESQFVPVKLNADENSATAQWFGITRVPTDVVITADGEVVSKLISPPTPAAYVAETTGVATKHATRLGQTYARAATAAPVQPQINAAYANLQVAPNTLPAAAPQLVPVAAPASAIPPLAASSASVASVDRFAAAPSSAPTITAAAVNLPAQQSFAPPPAAQPSQIANPYIAATTSGLAIPAQPPAPPQLAVNGTAGVMPTIGYDAAAAQPAPVATVATPAIVAPDPSRLPPNSPPLGFEGYCPVSMRNVWKWVPGDPRYGIVHRGRTYWFAGPTEQQQFWSDPDRYTPALSGMDPVLAIDHQQQVPGKREHSIDYDNLFYMFASEATLQQFTANPQRYSASVRQAMGIPRGRLVR